MMRSEQNVEIIPTHIIFLISIVVIFSDSLQAL